MFTRQFLLALHVFGGLSAAAPYGHKALNLRDEYETPESAVTLSPVETPTPSDTSTLEYSTEFDNPLYNTPVNKAVVSTGETKSPAYTPPANTPSSGTKPPAYTPPANTPSSGTKPPAYTPPANTPSSGTKPPAYTPPANTPSSGTKPPAYTPPANTPSVVTPPAVTPPVVSPPVVSPPVVSPPVVSPPVVSPPVVSPPVVSPPVVSPPVVSPPVVSPPVVSPPVVSPPVVSPPAGNSSGPVTITKTETITISKCPSTNIPSHTPFKPSHTPNTPLFPQGNCTAPYATGTGATGTGTAGPRGTGAYAYNPCPPFVPTITATTFQYPSSGPGRTPGSSNPTNDITVMPYETPVPTPSPSTDNYDATPSAEAPKETPNDTYEAPEETTEAPTPVSSADATPSPATPSPAAASTPPATYGEEAPKEESY